MKIRSRRQSLRPRTKTASGQPSGQTVSFDESLATYLYLLKTHYINNSTKGVYTCRKAVGNLIAGVAAYDDRNDFLPDALLANLKVGAGKYRAAIALYERAIEAVERRRGDLWKSAGKTQELGYLDYYNSVLAILRNNLAVAKSKQGRAPRDAVKILERAIRDDLPSWDYLFRTLASIHEEQGEWDEAERACWDASRFTGDEAGCLEQLGHMQRRRAEAAKKANDPARAIAALELGSSHFKKAEKAEDTQWAGKCQFDMGVLLEGRGKLPDAIARFDGGAALYEQSGDFSSAGHLRERAGDLLTRLGKRTDAIAAYTATLELIEKKTDVGDDKKRVGDDMDTKAGLHAKIGILRLADQDFEGANESLANARDLWTRNGKSDPYRRSVRAASTILDEPPLRLTLRSYLEDMLATAQEPAVRRGAWEALLELYNLYAEEISRDFRPPDRPSADRPEMIKMYPVVTPIAIAIDGELIHDENESLLIERFIPEMRSRIEDVYGVQIPGVRVRRSEVGDVKSFYILMINEIPLEWWRVSPGKKLFTGSRAKLREHAIAGEEIILPDSGDSGFWIAREDWGRATDAGLELWDTLEYPVKHLQSLLVKHLPLFLGHQEVMDRLEATDCAATSIARDSTEALTALTAILRALLEERVPVVDFKAIADEFARRWSAIGDLASLIVGIRVLPPIRPKLWGNNRDYSFYRLSEGFERVLRRQFQCAGGIGVLAMEQEEYWKTLNVIREKVGGRKKFALVVRDPVLRSPLRKLVSSELPDLPVLSYAELLPELGSRILGQIQRRDEGVVAEPEVMVEREAPAHE